MARNIKRDRKAISPVISTIIIVAIAIAIAIAVAYWMVGITGAYVKVEKLEMTTCYATANTTHYTVYITVKDTGSTDVTLDKLFLNAKPYDTFTGVSIEGSWNSPVTPGTARSFKVYLPYNSAPFTPGTSLDISLVSVTGREYPKMLTLP